MELSHGLCRSLLWSGFPVLRHSLANTVLLQQWFPSFLLAMLGQEGIAIYTPATVWGIRDSSSIDQM